MTVNELSKDFMQILNLRNKEEQDKQALLFCNLDPNSVLYEPIESLRKLLYWDSDDEVEDKEILDSNDLNLNNREPKRNKIRKKG